MNVLFVIILSVPATLFCFPLKPIFSHVPLGLFRESAFVHWIFPLFCILLLSQFMVFFILIHVVFSSMTYIWISWLLLFLDEVLVLLFQKMCNCLFKYLCNSSFKIVGGCFQHLIHLGIGIYWVIFHSFFDLLEYLYDKWFSISSSTFFSSLPTVFFFLQ